MDPIEYLSWDSDHFGLPVARVRAPVGAERVGAAVRAADREGVRCLTALIASADTSAIAAAESAGFHCYDVRIELDREVRAGRRSDGVRPAVESDFERIEPIAAGSFSDSRFYADLNFPRPAVSALYAAWLRRGLSGEDRLVLTTSDRDGFVICHFERDAAVGTVELIAVAESARGRGQGGRLVLAAEAAFAEAGMEAARVVTQGANLAAQRLYQREGYRTRDVSLWLHRWSVS